MEHRAASGERDAGAQNRTTQQLYNSEIILKFISTFALRHESYHWNYKSNWCIHLLSHTSRRPLFHNYIMMRFWLHESAALCLLSLHRDVWTARTAYWPSRERWRLLLRKWEGWCVWSERSSCLPSSALGPWLTEKPPTMELPNPAAPVRSPQTQTTTQIPQQALQKLRW